MNSNLEAIIALSVVFVIFFILYYNTKEIYSDKTLYISGASYGVSILTFIAIVILVIIVLTEVLK
jgi:hypothetical protein